LVKSKRIKKNKRKKATEKSTEKKKKINLKLFYFFL